MNKQEIEQRIEYLRNYIDLMHRSIKESEDELELLKAYRDYEEDKNGQYR